jgi:hypothetical protein
MPIEPKAPSIFSSGRPERRATFRRMPLLHKKTSWETSPTWRRSSGRFHWRTSRPPTRTDPESTSWKRQRRLLMVVLPAPVWPTKAADRTIERPPAPRAPCGSSANKHMKALESIPDTVSGAPRARLLHHEASDFGGTILRAELASVHPHESSHAGKTRAASAFSRPISHTPFRRAREDSMTCSRVAAVS